MAESTENATKKQVNLNLLSLLPKFELKVPFFGKEPKQVEPVGKESPNKVTGADAETENISVKSNLVRFRDSNRPIIPAPLEFENEEPAGRTSIPVVLWQLGEDEIDFRFLTYRNLHEVYALGGFLVVRWVWARWKERKERAAKKESSDDSETQADDDDYHST